MLQKRTSQRQEQVPSPPQQSDTPPTKSREERSKIEKPLTSRELPAGKTHSECLSLEGTHFLLCRLSEKVILVY